MAGNKTNAPQVVSKDVLSRLYRAADYFADDADNVELSTLLQSIDLNFRPPLELSATTPTPNLVVNIGAISVSNTETTRNRVIPPISNLLPAFTSGTVTFPASSGGNATPSVGSAIVITVSSGNFIKVGINIDALGNLVLITGTQGASEAAATVPPSVPNTFGIGYVTLQNVAGTIQNITDAAIYQFVGGGGGGSGSGDASSILENLRNQVDASTWLLVTPIIFKSDEDDYVDGASTGAFSLVTQQFEFSAGAQTLVSTNLLDAEEFLTEALDLPEIDLSVFWGEGKVDTAATYEASRNGGGVYSPITMERVGSNTETYTGNLKFAEEVDGQSVSLDSNATTDGNTALNATTAQQLGTLFTIAAGSVARKITLGLTKTGSPTGLLYINIYKNNAGVPSVLPEDLVFSSSAIDITGVSTGTYTLSLGRVPLAAGDYHITLVTDATYKSGFSAGVTQLAWNRRSTGGSGFSTYNGTSWSPVATTEAVFDALGYALDLRVRITSSAGSKALDGLGAFYNKQPGVPVAALQSVAKFQFAAVANNTSSFTLPFLPDLNALSVYYVEAGQVFKFPSFSVSGFNVVFPTNTFNNGGVEATVTLIFDQTKGGGYDNSDQNAVNIGYLQSLLFPNLRGSEGAGTTTLLSTDNPWQIFNLSAARTVVLPSTGIAAGQRIRLENRGSFDLTVQSSSLAEITYAAAGAGSLGAATINKGYVNLIALQTTPTLPSHWMVEDAYEEVVKALDNQFTGGTGILVRRNRIVTAQVQAPTWTGSRSSTSTSNTFIPARMNPTATTSVGSTIHTLTATSSANILEIRSDNQITWIVRDSGVLTTPLAIASTGPATIGLSGTYMV